MKSFARGLSWAMWHNRQRERRPEFPSWSWLGWKTWMDPDSWLKEWDVACQALSPVIHLNKFDETCLNWETVITGLKTGVLDEKNLAHAITLDCWTLPFTLVKPLRRKLFAKIEIGDRVYREELTLEGSVSNIGHNNFLGICFPDREYHIEIVIVVRQTHDKAWERVGSFWPPDIDLGRCPHETACTISHLCEHFPLKRQTINWR
jgi:hypothetical protein